MDDKLPSITELDHEQLSGIVKRLGEPGYRVEQIRNQVYRRLVDSFEEMTDLPHGFRQALAEQTRLHSIDAAHQITGRDGTMKTVFRLADKRTVEAALMSYPRRSGSRRFTTCVSTQAGCAIGCPFCATGQQGFERNLTIGEIIDQVLYFARYLRNDSDDEESLGVKNGKRIGNIVFMGMGEPLANYDNLWRAIEILNSPDYFGLGARNMTISTSGLVPQIRRLAKEELQVGLAVSLHASDNELRDRLVPINRKYPLEKLIPACREYSRSAGRRLSFEYVLFRNINDSVDQARSLAGLLRGLKCHVNLIPANNTGNSKYAPPAREQILKFERELSRFHINATIRQPRGIDIEAGCGQLRGSLARKLV